MIRLARPDDAAQIADIQNPVIRVFNGIGRVMPGTTVAMWAATLACLLVIIASGWFLHRFVEQPGNRRLRSALMKPRAQVAA